MPSQPGADAVASSSLVRPTWAPPSAASQLTSRWGQTCGHTQSLTQPFTQSFSYTHAHTRMLTHAKGRCPVISDCQILIHYKSSIPFWMSRLGKRTRWATCVTSVLWGYAFSSSGAVNTSLLYHKTHNRFLTRPASTKGRKQPPWPH